MQYRIAIGLVVIMHSLSCSIRHLTLALAVAVALLSTCLSQEVASIDLTKIEARVVLRSPKSTPPITRGASGTEIYDCPEGFPHPPQPDVGTQKVSAHSGVALRASLESLDRTRYQVGDTSKFEVMVENTGLGPIRIPFSPHLADLQPKDPAQKFTYSELDIVLWVAAGRNWWANTGGEVVLYGSDENPGTLLLLHPGQWARIIGEGKFALPSDQVNVDSHPVDHLYAEASLYRDETLMTPAQSATVKRGICVAHTPGQSVPIQLTIP